MVRLMRIQMVKEAITKALIGAMVTNSEEKIMNKMISGVPGKMP